MQSRARERGGALLQAGRAWLPRGVSSAASAERLRECPGRAPAAARARTRARRRAGAAPYPMLTLY